MPDEPLSPALADAVARLRRLPHDAPHAREALRSAVRAAGRPARGTRDLSRAGRVLAIGLAAALVVATAIGVRGTGRGGAAGAPSATAGNVIPVHFDVQAASARQVALVGDFNAWDTGSLELTRRGDRWSITIPLRAGRYAYAFVIDSTWTADAAAPLVPSDFGRATSVVVVPASEIR